MADIVVIGSINMDLVVRCPRHPRPGETVLGSDFDTYPGGKGANQAVAAARAAGSGPGSLAVAMLGRVGDDGFGRTLLQGMADAGVAVEGVRVDPDHPTGVAVITVDASGENAIVVAPGANGYVSAADVEAAAPLIAGARFVLLQLEIPLPAVARAVQLARQAGVGVLLDPAPAPPAPLPGDLLAGVEVVTPNEGEAEALTGVAAGDTAGAMAAARALLDRGCRRALVTLGARGAVLAVAGDGPRLIPGFKVRAVDATGAGDAFSGALAVALAEGRNWEQAVRFAHAAAALAVTRRGAQSSLAGRRAIDRFLATGAATA